MPGLIILAVLVTAAAAFAVRFFRERRPFYGEFRNAIGRFA